MKTLNYDLGNWFQLSEFFKKLPIKTRELVEEMLKEQNLSEILHGQLTFLEQKKTSQSQMTHKDNEKRTVATTFLFCLAFKNPEIFQKASLLRFIPCMPSDYSREAVQVLIQALHKELKNSEKYAINLAYACHIFGYENEKKKIHECIYNKNA